MPPDWRQSAQYAYSPWASHLWGKHIAKDCMIHHQQVPRDMPTDDLELAEDSNVQSRLAHITQENHAIKVQLSQLTELVWQLLPQIKLVVPQLASASNLLPMLSPAEGQSPGTSGASLSLPPPSWLHPRDTASGIHLVVIRQCH